ncbi:NB-ARC domain-containing protein [Streptomyces sp. NBC_01591]|uniref:NB-ARC domain-containing protein n=1 Tax=Streptomyces sp. NBC_01591 TaxID=2975888 RepID=UPI002DD920C5|nr:NB-ARC domain-containing protein [Streptomyces sp. NBC_01591]WSD66485.1 NB-ARC domain-containing protein [Streptomyces sp. NBC_01591]
MALAAVAAFGGRPTVDEDPPPPAAPAVPAWVVDREESRRAVAAVCAPEAADVGITTSLEGAGGFGKSTLATLVCSNRQVRRRFRNRVYTVTVGRDVRGRAAIAAKVAEATAFITGDTTAFDDPDRAGDHLWRLLSRRPRTLLVLDDVWEPDQLAPFLRSGRNCVRLVTTRVPAVLPPGSARVRVDEMSPEQARAVLTWELPGLPEDLVAGLLRATGRWALLLRLTNRLIARLIATGADPVAAARHALEGLRTQGPALGEPPAEPLDLDDPARRSRAVRATVEAGITLLPEGGARRLAELSVFIEDESIPVPLVVRLWQATAGLAELPARELCALLDRLSLVTLSPVNGGRIVLHDVLRDYLRSELGQVDLRRLHAVLIDATLPDDLQSVQDGYLLDHAVEHLLAAGQDSRAERLAGDLGWVEARLHQRGPAAPSSDLARIPTPTAAALARDLTRAAPLLAPLDSPQMLASVLHGRLAQLPHWDHQIAARWAADIGLRPQLVPHWPLPDLPDPHLLQTLAQPGNPLLSVAIDPAGTWVATGDAAGEVVIRDASTHAVLAREFIDAGRIGALVPHPDDGSLTVVAGFAVLSVDPRGGRPAEVLFVCPEEARHVVVAPQGHWYAVTDGRGHIHIGDRSSIAYLHHPFQVAAHRSGRRPLAVSPDSRLLAVACRDGWVRVWDTVTHTQTVQVCLSLDPARIIAFSADGAFLVIADSSGWIRRYDLTGHSAPQEPRLRETELLTTRADRGEALTVAPSGNWYATGSSNGLVRLWRLSDRRAFAVLRGHAGAITSLVAAPDGSWLAGTGRDGTVRLWEVPPEPSVAEPNEPSGAVAAVGYAHDGARLATARLDTTVRIHETVNGTEAQLLSGLRSPGRSLAWAPDGSWLAASAEGEYAVVWDPADGAVLTTIRNRPDGLDALAAAPDGSWLVGAGPDGVPRLWDPRSGRLLGELSGAGPARSIAVFPDGTRIATAGDEGVVTVWDLATRTPVTRLTGGSGAVVALSVAPDGRWLFGAGEDGTVRLWNPRSGAYRALETGDGRPVRSVATSPDGRWIASAGADATVRVWDRASGHLVAAQRTEAPLRSCSWRPDGRFLAVGGERGLYVYDFRPARSGNGPNP